MTLSRDSERVARDWLCEPQGNPETAGLRHGVRLLLEDAAAEIERLRASIGAEKRMRKDSDDQAERLRAIVEDRNEAIAVFQDVVERLRAEIRRVAVRRNRNFGPPWWCAFCEAEWADGQERHHGGCAAAEAAGGDDE